jgi:hypothetical protein
MSRTVSRPKSRLKRHNRQLVYVYFTSHSRIRVYLLPLPYSGPLGWAPFKISISISLPKKLHHCVKPGRYSCGACKQVRDNALLILRHLRRRYIWHHELIQLSKITYKQSTGIRSERGFGRRRLGSLLLQLTHTLYTESDFVSTYFLDLTIS